MLRHDQLDAALACVLVIDVQEKLLPLIPQRAAILRAGKKLLDGARIFELPVLATEQYPKGLGPTHATLRVNLRANHSTILEKPTFSACGHEPIRTALRSIDRPQIIVMGVETHICVLQTALDLVAMDYTVVVCADATGSRSRPDYDLALHRMRQAGAIVSTVETVLFELCNRCDTIEFKRMLEVIKASPPEN